MITDKERKALAHENNDLYRDKTSYPNKQLKFSLPLPPSVNHMYIPKRNGAKVLNSRAKNYVKESRALINLSIDDQHWVKQEYAVWYYIDLVFYMPDRRIRDSHNMLKLLLDVMQDIIFHNDYFVMPRIQGVEYDVDNPRVDACITPQTETSRERGIQITNVGI